MRSKNLCVRSRLLMWLVLVFMALPAFLFAQPKVATKPAESAERRIYVPYRNWSSLLKQNDPTVFIPLSQYQELLKQAAKGRAKAPAGPAVSAVVTEAHYTATVEKGFVRMSAALTVRALADFSLLT